MQKQTIKNQFVTPNVLTESATLDKNNEEHVLQLYLEIIIN
tara:strand:- start:5976 stop:6098 length:123 start_codon:yes stop_codon:yes gene_type:complete